MTPRLLTLAAATLASITTLAQQAAPTSTPPTAPTATPTLAPSETKSDDAKVSVDKVGRDILAAMIDATRKARTIACTVVTTSTLTPKPEIKPAPKPGSPTDSASNPTPATPKITEHRAAIVLGEPVEKGEGLFARKFLVTGTIPDIQMGDFSKAVPVHTAFDGATIFEIKDESKVVQTAAFSPDKVRFAFLPAMFAVPGVLMDAENSNVAPPDASVMVPGPTTLDGIECDVVEVHITIPMDPDPVTVEGADPASDPGNQTLIFRYTIGKKDHLLRRLDYPEFDMPDGAMTTSIAMKGLVIDGAVDAKTFSPALPEGYKTEDLVLDDPSMGMPKLAFDVGDTPADFTLKDASGKEHTLSSYKGKVVMLDFWATWCPPCKEAMPYIQKMHEDLAKDGLVVLGIAVDNQGDPAKFMEKKGFTYTGLLDGGTVSNAYGIAGIPQLYIIGRDGKVVFQETGFTRDNVVKIREAVENALKTKP